MPISRHLGDIHPQMTHWLCKWVKGSKSNEIDSWRTVWELLFHKQVPYPLLIDRTVGKCWVVKVGLKKAVDVWRIRKRTGEFCQWKTGSLASAYIPRFQICLEYPIAIRLMFLQCSEVAFFQLVQRNYNNYVSHNIIVYAYLIGSC